MTTQSQQAIINEARTFLARKQMSQAELAEKIGYSDAVLSQVFKGTYPGDNTQVLSKLAKVVGITEFKWDILNTFNYQAVQNLCLDAQEAQRMVAVYGDTGSGKSEALERYYRNTQNCYYVLADVLMKPKDLLVAIQRAIGVDEEGTLSERLDSIVRKLESRQFPLLIIDDCGKLEMHPKCFGIIQLLYDRLLNRTGIVLAGTKRFGVYFNKMAGKDALGFRELKRRISYWQPMREGVEPTFIKKQCDIHGITQKEAIEYMSRHCTNYGDVKELIRNFKRYRDTKGVDADEQLQVLSHLKFNKLS